LKLPSIDEFLKSDRFHCAHVPESYRPFLNTALASKYEGTVFNLLIETIKSSP